MYTLSTLPFSLQILRERNENFAEGTLAYSSRQVVRLSLYEALLYPYLWLSHSTPWPLFWHISWIPKEVSAAPVFWNSTFFVCQDFDCEPRYACFSIILCLNVAFLFYIYNLVILFSVKPLACWIQICLNLNDITTGSRVIAKRAFLTVRKHFLKRCNFLVYPLL
jgi:hypothetical protein